MKKIMILGVGAVLFGVSFGLSMMMNAAPAAEKEKEEKTPEIKPISSDDGEIPKAFKPESMTAETVIRLSDSLRRREKAIDGRQAMLERKEQQITLLLDDLSREREALEMLRIEIDQKLSDADPIFTRILDQQEKEMVADASQENGAAAGPNELTPVSNREKQNIKTIAGWMIEMTPEQAAGQFKQYANDGKLDLAARLLGHIDEKQAAKILGALNDPVLMSELIDRLKLLDDEDEEAE